MPTIPHTSIHSNSLTRMGTYVRNHKVASIMLTLAVFGGGYWWYSSTHSAATATQYTLGTVSTGTVISIVSASGQISPSNQVTINPKASGTITRVLVREGQTVAAGTPLAYIESTDQYNAVKSAQTSLESAQLSLQKLQKPADQLSTTQSQNAIARAQESAQAAQVDLAKAYANGYNDIVATYLDLPTIMTGVKDIIVGTEASNGSQWNIDYYQNAIVNWDTNALAYHDTAYDSYTTALAAYNKALGDYQLTNQTSSTSTIDATNKETYAMAQAVSTALNRVNSFIQFYEDQVKSHSRNPSNQADTSLTNLNTYIGKMNTHLSTLLADQNAITADATAIASAQRTIVEDQLSLQKLQAGADSLDIQSSELSVQQQQTALAQAQANLGNYTIRAPIAGTIAILNLHVGDTVSSGTSAATEITTQQVADLSLNEVDAAKVAAGQKVTLTFDAIPDLTLTGTVTGVSALGTVAQGVVSYTVKIATDAQDPRVKAGMTVNADIQTAVHQHVLIVPSSAVKTTAGSRYVQVFSPPLPDAEGSVVTPAQTPTDIPVTLGISDDTNTEITSGITAGEQIITKTTGNSATKTTAATATSRGGFGGGGGGNVLRGL